MKKRGTKKNKKIIISQMEEAKGGRLEARRLIY